MNERDRFTTDVLREAFFAVTEEMFVALQRTSQSPVIYEVLDYAVGLTDAHGELVSQGNGIAGFLGPLGEVVRDTLVRVPDLAPGDVIATNDPYAGGGSHLSDVALVRPIFVEDELVAFAGAKGHWTEVGGKDPGSWTADSVEIYQEGLQLPFVRVARASGIDRDLAAVIAANCRLPDQTLGDLTAFAACLEVAERRVLELCARYGTATITDAMRAVHERSEALSRAAVASLPRGVFEAEDFVDEDGLGNGPFPIRVRVTIDGERVVADFTGSHPQVPGPVNCTRSGLISGVRTVFKAITGPNEPGSDAWFRPFEVVCPPGTILTAERPAPVALYFESTEAATDLVWKALAPSMPERLTAGSFVSVCATAISCTHPDTGEPTLLVEPQAGGWGAGTEIDGQHALVSVGDGETYVIPVEVCEQRYGIRVERFGFDVVDAGAGRRRGGRGLVREYRMLSDGSLTVGFGRNRYPPWGMDGGRDGSPNHVEVVRADGTREGFGKAARFPLREGDLVRLITGTGGGVGDPRERERERVRTDLADGIITDREAREAYGLADEGRG
ncbi:MAG TPA: hydantoinase B/oxoprolinase family protein [Actinomycetota bacterium]|nr:hydantoinase B/oxoprolinase family protein [Actinomycetota bacterium]